METTAKWNSSNTRTLVHLTVAVESWMPFVKLEADPHDEAVSLTGGAMKPFFEVLLNATQASYHLVSPADHEWGSKTGNGSWTGMIGIVVNEKADIALGPFTYNFDRYQVVDFGGILHVSDINVLTKYTPKEPAASNQEDILMKLTDTDWKVSVCLLLCLCLLPLVCMSMENSFPKFRYYFYFIGAFFGQGAWIVSPNISIRMVLVSFWLAAIVLSIYINGVLHLSMVVQSGIKFVDSFNDLHRAAFSLGLCPVFQYGSASLNLFRESSDPLMRDLLVMAENCNGFTHAPHENHFVKRFNKENLALVDDGVGLTALSRAFCNAYPKLHLHSSSEGQFPAFLGFVMAKQLNANLKRIFLRKVIFIYESGLMSKWIDKVEADEGDVPCLENSNSKDDETQEIHVNLQAFRGVFQVWGVGLASAALALCLEKAISCIMPKKVPK